MAEVARAGTPAAAFSSRPRTVRIAGGGAPSPYPSTSSRPTRCPRRRRGLFVPFGCRASTEASSPWPLLDAVAHCAGARGPILWNAGFQQELVDFARENDLLVERQQQRRHEEQEEMITR